MQYGNMVHLFFEAIWLGSFIQRTKELFGWKEKVRVLHPCLFYFFLSKWSLSFFAFLVFKIVSFHIPLALLYMVAWEDFAFTSVGSGVFSLYETPTHHLCRIFSHCHESRSPCHECSILWPLTLVIFGFSFGWC